MAVTNLIQAPAFSPAYNPQWFKSSSTQTAQPNFVYTLILTDIISGETITKNVDPDPAGRMVFDVGSFAEQYITQVNPANLYGFQVNSGAIRTIRVNVGETYGATPTYYAGANYDYIIWNGSLDTLSDEVRDMQNFSYPDYVYGGNNIQLITNNRNPLYAWNPSSTTPFYSFPETVIENRSSYLYCLTSTTSYFQKLRILCFDTGGSQIGSTLIQNAYSASASYLYRYVFIDVGYDGLTNMPAGQVVSGTFPIPVSGAAYWEVYDESAWLPTNPDPVAVPWIYPLKRFNRVCECRYDIIELHYLSPQGSFESQVCAKLSLKTTDVNKTTYSKLPYDTSGTGAVTYNYGSSIENVSSSVEQSKITVNTDWLEEYEVKQLKDAISAKIIYCDFGNTRGYRAMKMITNSFQQKKKYNEKLISVQFDLEYSNVNVRQRG